MGRTLDEDAVFKEIGRWIGYLDEDMIERIKIGIKKLPEAQQWIPCSERRPEEGEKCLVSDEGRIFIDTYIGYGIPYNWQLYVRDYEAWMPLPESYKGEE